MIALIFAASLGSSGGNAWGADALGEYYRGVRAMGMGDAYTAIADDADSVFYNPAGLAHVKSVEFVLLNPKLDIGQDDITYAKSLEGSSLSGAALTQFFGEHIYGDGSVMPMILFPGFALGYYDDYQASVVARNLSMPALDVTYVHDRGLVGGLAHEFNMGRHQFLDFGISGKMITRNGFDQTMYLQDMLLLNKAYFDSLAGNSASGFGATVGFQYQIQMNRTSDIVFSGVWQDIGDTSFGPENMVNRPPMIPQNVAAGFAWIQRFSTNYRSDNNFKLTAEMRHLEETGVNPELKLHVGGELQIGMLSFQGGLNGDSLCAGAGVNLGFFDVRAVTYGVEDESEPYLDRERRYMLQMTFKFDLFGKKFKSERDQDREKHPRAY